MAVNIEQVSSLFRQLAAENNLILTQEAEQRKDYDVLTWTFWDDDIWGRIQLSNEELSKPFEDTEKVARFVFKGLLKNMRDDRISQTRQVFRAGWNTGIEKILVELPGLSGAQADYISKLRKEN